MASACGILSYPRMHGIAAWEEGPKYLFHIVELKPVIRHGSAILPLHQLLGRRQINQIPSHIIELNYILPDWCAPVESMTEIMKHEQWIHELLNHSTTVTWTPDPFPSYLDHMYIWNRKKSSFAVCKSLYRNADVGGSS